MLVYRSARRMLDVGEVLTDLEDRAAMIDRVPTGFDELRSLLIDAGQFESGSIDAACPDCDDDTPLYAPLDALSRLLGDAFASMWRGMSVPRETFALIRQRLREVKTLAGNDCLEVSTPEGFAFYGLFPETYIDAAAELVRSRTPNGVMVIGVRSIGTTLSAVVAAALRLEGVMVERVTVRPRGHPFDRELRLGAALRYRLHTAASQPQVLFAIVDEGPGLSGSSFASVVESLTGLGVPDERIVLLPSWNPEPRMLGNPRAQHIWMRHAKFAGDFDRAWIASGRLERAIGARIEQDLSAGGWRKLFRWPQEEQPPIHPQHERRKFLACRPDGEQMLIKFEGLDRAAGSRCARARRSAAAGFSVHVEQTAHGFVGTRWLDGHPIEKSDVTPELVHRVAGYLAWISTRERTGHPANPAPLLEMLRVNTEERWGAEWAAKATRQLMSHADSVASAPAVRVDGRMLPHEWIRVDNRFVKTDGNSHFDDHFYPGETDIAWDLAGAVVELNLGVEAEQLLVREYQTLSGDRAIAPRLKFMRPAYAAFRLGYTTMAGGALRGTEDGDRMRRVASHYAEVLRHELTTKELDGQSYATGAEVPAR